jgi:hypothetical protein
LGGVDFLLFRIKHRLQRREKDALISLRDAHLVEVVWKPGEGCGVGFPHSSEQDLKGEALPVATNINIKAYQATPTTTTTTTTTPATTALATATTTTTPTTTTT